MRERKWKGGRREEVRKGGRREGERKGDKSPVLPLHFGARLIFQNYT